MWTSRPLLRDAGVIFTAAAALAMALRFAVPELEGLRPHPVWLLVLWMAAVRGNEGLAVAIPAAWGAVGAVAWTHGEALALFGGKGPWADLSALLGVVGVSWIGSLHLSRLRDRSARVRELEELTVEQERRSRELERAAAVLRERVDRMDISLAFLRDVARAIDHADAPSAAHAALELALRRFGARAGTVQAWEEGHLVPVAWRGDPGGDSPAALALLSDRTARAAAERRRALRGQEVEDTTPQDSDLAAPIGNGKGALYGVIALWGVPQVMVTDHALEELTVLGAWCSAPLAERASHRQQGSAEAA